MIYNKQDKMNKSHKGNTEKSSQTQFILYDSAYGEQLCLWRERAKVARNTMVIFKD